MTGPVVKLAFGGSEARDDRGNFLSTSAACSWRGLHHTRDAPCTSSHGPSRIKMTWCHRVHPDVRREVLRQRMGEMHQTCLGGGVGHHWTSVSMPYPEVIWTTVPPARAHARSHRSDQLIS
jgi:hypothetical protein